MTVHLRYMNLKETTVCDDPELLGDFFIVSDVPNGAYEDRCRECSILLTVHNKREFEKEEHPSLTPMLLLPEDKPGISKEALMYGALFSTAFWLVVGVIVWAVFFHG